MNITREKHDELLALIEDSVEYFCNENMVSGELAYTIMNCYSEAKIAQFQGECVWGCDSW